jgi:hypothetical protein
VDHADIGHLDPGRPVHRTFRIGGEHEHIIGRQPLGLITEGHQFTGVRIDLRMRREGLALQPTVEGVVIVHGLEGQRIERDRRAVLLHRQEALVVIENLRVRGAAAQTRDARIIGGRIAIHAEQRAARRVLRLPALRAHIAAAKVHMSVLDAEGADRALAIEGNVVGVDFRLRVLRIRADPKEDTVEVLRQGAVDFAVIEIIFRPIHRAHGTAAAAEAAAVLGELNLGLSGARQYQAAHGCGRPRAGTGHGAHEAAPA